jgi:LuxR family maltose regulon positive regulatory protein
MSTPILATKLYIPPPRTKIVLRPRLIERLNEGLQRKLTIISASAGFGKTTLVSEWVASCERPIAWLSLDEGDNDSTRFLTYLVAALQTIAQSKVEGVATKLGAGVLNVLQSPQPPPIESILTVLLNEITIFPNNFILVLDDYHVIESKPVDQALTFLLAHQPPQMHLVIATREDPSLPLARLRVRDQLTELRTADLRFTPAEAAEFLNRMMGLNLSDGDVAALEARTEGWIAGLQMAAISMQGLPDASNFIQSFTGSHRFVLDYLLEEVLHCQPVEVQTFLLLTSILERLCGSLCDAVLGSPSASGQKTLEYLERANLFIVPLDNERRWYRYHHLFADLMCKRLEQSPVSEGISELHIRASAWYENNNLTLEAFRHAAAANDIERAVRLMESKGMPLHLPGAATAVLNWLESLPKTVLNAQPGLWWKQASLLLVSGQTERVEEKLQATEAALAAAAMPGADFDDKTRNLIGKIAVARASLAEKQHQVETILVQARRALEYLHPNNLPYRSEAIQAMGYAYYLQGDRAAAGRAYSEALSLAQVSGNIINTILATTCLGQIRQLENQLYLAAETYQSVLQLVDDYSPSNAGVVYFGLARICYEWNDLDAAERHGEQTMQLARQYNQFINRFILCGVFLSRLKLVRGDVDGAATLLAQAEQAARQHNFMHRMPEVAAVQALMLLRQGNLSAAAELAQQYELPMIQARVLLSQGNPSAALAVLGLYRQQVEAKNWQDERLKVIVLQAVAYHAHCEKDKAVQILNDALALAEPGGFIRLFVDEGSPMAQLLSEAAARGIMTNYIGRLLVAFGSDAQRSEDKPDLPPAQPLIAPLNQRELDVLRLIAQGFSNREIGERLFLALSTVKGHTRIIFDKLQVQRRTEAVARARELGLL